MERLAKFGDEIMGSKNGQKIIDLIRGKSKFYFAIGKKNITPIKLLKEQFDFIKKENEKLDRGFKIDWKDRFLCLNDSTQTTGFDVPYVYHVAWAIRKVKEINPAKHFDISSSIYFCSNVSAIVPTEFYDYRPASIFLSNLKCDKANLSDLQFEDNSIECLSCMHTVEHVGLARYGDELDVNGDLKAINELKRVVKKGGYLIFVVPVGKPRIQFNAHRIYSYEQILGYFSDLELKEFSLIPDNGLEVGMIENADKELVNEQKYACGCFVFKKGE